MASWRKHFKPVTVKSNSSGNSVLPMQDRSYTNGSQSMHKFSSWLPEFYQGQPNRTMRYGEWDNMDMLDHEINASLDIIAEFCTQPNSESDLPFEFKFNGNPTESETEAMDIALRQWCKVNDFKTRMFKMFRSTIKYGDQFFIRDPETYKLLWIDPTTVTKVVVNESEGKDIEAYYVKDLDLNLQSLTATNSSTLSSGTNTNFMGTFPGGSTNNQSGQPATPFASPSNSNGNSVGHDEFPVDAVHVVHFSLGDGMDNNWPFGASILEPIMKVYKQKQLLEDAILIYRVQRAPERRVFYVDVGNMPTNRAQSYLERVRYEVQQKRVPSRTGGGTNVADAAYNPMSTLEDYFFAQTAEGRGSKVEVLPGGQNLGEIDDLLYFNNKLMRGLRVPSSYLPTGPDDGSATYNDGRVGTAYLQEYRFAKYCKRLQDMIVQVFDREFKLFMKRKGVNIDSGDFDLTFTEPQNFSKYREIELESAHAGVFNNLSDTEYLSKRFLMKKYLGLNEDEILENEKYWKEEHGISDPSALNNLDLKSVGVNAGGGGGDFGGFGGDLGGDENFGDDLGGDDSEGDAVITGDEGEI